MNDLTQDDVVRLLNYDASTGYFTWRADVAYNVKEGSIAGYNNSNGYRIITINKRSYKAHRLAWLYTYGEFPSGSIDHIDRDKGNNAITNLRIATAAENGQNRNAAKGKKQKTPLGVSFNKSKRNCTKQYGAAIQVNKKQRHLGWFKTPEEASEAYMKAKNEIHPFWEAKNG